MAHVRRLRTMMEKFAACIVPSRFSAPQTIATAVCLIWSLSLLSRASREQVVTVTSNMTSKVVVCRTGSTQRSASSPCSTDRRDVIGLKLWLKLKSRLKLKLLMSGRCWHKNRRRRSNRLLDDDSWFSYEKVRTTMVKVRKIFFATIIFIIFF